MLLCMVRGRGNETFVSTAIGVEVAYELLATRGESGHGARSCMH